MPPIYFPFCSKCGTQRIVDVLPSGQDDVYCPKCRKLEEEIKIARKEDRINEVLPQLLAVQEWREKWGEG